MNLTAEDGPVRRIHCSHIKAISGSDGGLKGIPWGWNQEMFQKEITDHGVHEDTNEKEKFVAEPDPLLYIDRCYKEFSAVENLGN